MSKKPVMYSVLHLLRLRDKFIRNLRCLQVNFYSVRFQTPRQFIMVFSILHLSPPHKPEVTLNFRDSPQVRTVIYDGEAATFGSS